MYRKQYEHKFGLDNNVIYRYNIPITGGQNMVKLKSADNEQTYSEPDELDLVFTKYDSAKEIEEELEHGDDISENEEDEEDEEGGREDDTSDTTDPFILYLKEIGNIRLLTAAEERELAIRKSNGDKEAANKLVESNLRLVIKIAKRYFYKDFGMQILDYIQNGNLGLLKAVEKYDYKKGYRFSTYATYWIKQSVLRETQKQEGVIGLPVQIKENITKINKYIGAFMMENNREPTLSELAKEVGLSVDEIKNIWKWKQGPVSLDEPFHTDETDYDGTIGSKIADDDSKDPYEQVAKIMLIENLKIIEKKLSPKEYDIIKRRYGLNGGREQTLGEIAVIYGLTRERIRQLEREAIDKLSDMPEIGVLADYLE